VLSLMIFLGTWFMLRSFGNAGLWMAMLALCAARRGLQGTPIQGKFSRVIQPDGGGGLK
jgi:hypothetical protein